MARAARLHRDLINQNVLRGNVLTWEKIEYDVSSNYVICEAYEGICIKGYQAGFNEPLILAVSYDTEGKLAIQPVDYTKFKRERSQEAIDYYQRSRKITEEQVFTLKDPKGQDLFDTMGNLTKQGEATYESELEGRKTGEARLAPKKKPADSKKGKSAKKGKIKGIHNTKFSKIPMKNLIEMGYLEIFEAELDCIHSIPADDSDLIMEKVKDAEGRTRYFMNPKDPSYNVAKKYRREKVCSPYGDGQFQNR